MQLLETQVDVCPNRAKFGEISPTHDVGLHGASRGRIRSKTGCMPKFATISASIGQSDPNPPNCCAFWGVASADENGHGSPIQRHVEPNSATCDPLLLTAAAPTLNRLDNIAHVGQFWAAAVQIVSLCVGQMRLCPTLLKLWLMLAQLGPKIVRARRCLANLGPYFTRLDSANIGPTDSANRSIPADVGRIRPDLALFFRFVANVGQISSQRGRRQ